MGDTLLPILSYGVGASGWTDELTRLHDETAGADHLIDRASRHHALQQLFKHARADCPVILELGCSSGHLLRALAQGPAPRFVIGADIVKEPLEHLARDLPDVPLLQLDLVSCPLPDNSIDVAVLLNVLEHISDDATAMRQVHRILKPGGIAIIEVPAGPHLYDVYDKVLLHCRRYSLPDLARLVEQAGLEVIEQSHLGFFMYPGFSIVKKRNRRFLAAREATQERLVVDNIRKTRRSRLLDALMRFELFLGRCVSYPIGIRCLVTCRKRC